MVASVLKELNKELAELLSDYKSDKITKKIAIIQFESCIDRMSTVLGADHEVVLDLRKRFKEVVKQDFIFKSIEGDLVSKELRLFSLREKAGITF